MTHLGMSFVFGLSTLEKYLNESRLRLTRNTQVKNALAGDQLRLTMMQYWHSKQSPSQTRN